MASLCLAPPVSNPLLKGLHAPHRFLDSADTTG